MSDRAIKHLEELTQLQKAGKDADGRPLRCAVLFIVNRWVLLKHGRTPGGRSHPTHRPAVPGLTQPWALAQQPSRPCCCMHLMALLLPTPSSWSAAMRSCDLCCCQRPTFAQMHI